MAHGIRRFVKKAEAAGVIIQYDEVVGLWHVWQLLARFVPEARTAITQIGEFIQHYTNTSDQATNGLKI
jgi:acetyl esterase/lipase